MGELFDEMRALAAEFANCKISIDAFRASFADLYFRARQMSRGDANANAFASRIVGPLAELSRGHRSEDSFRSELASAILPFDVEPEAQSAYGGQSNLGSNDYGGSFPIGYPASGNNNTGFNEVRSFAA